MLNGKCNVYMLVVYLFIFWSWWIRLNVQVYRSNRMNEFHEAFNIAVI